MNIGYHGIDNLTARNVLEDNHRGLSLHTICNKYDLDTNQIAGMVSKYKNYHVKQETRARNHRYYLNKKRKNYSKKFYQRTGAGHLRPHRR